MANIKSAKKRIIITARKTLRNKIIKSRTNTEIKKMLDLIKNNKKQEALSAFKFVSKFIDRAASKGVYHKNKSARKKSRLAKLVNNL